MVKMIKVFYGEKGMGKSKMMVDFANEHAEKKDGDVVFIDDSNDLMLKLKHMIRFIDVSIYPIAGSEQFFAFICGIISQNYDIESIFIDGLTYILKEDIGTLEVFFSNIASLMEKYGIHFIFSINGRPETMPHFLQAYV
jgi:GTPase SAR1 family protein